MKATSQSGFTLVEIMIVVTIVGLLAALALPSFARARTNAQTQICINNLRQISNAKEIWALENYQAPDAMPMPVDLSPYIKGGVNNVFCPLDPNKSFASSYVINDVATDPVCSLSKSHVGD